MAITFSAPFYDKFVRNKLEPTDGGAASQAYSQWIDEDYRNRQWWGRGPLPLACFPKAIQFVKGKKLYDFNSWTGSQYAVSQRLKDLIEAMEPGAHQFVPVQALYKDGAPCEQPLYFFTICQGINVITDARGGLRKDFWAADPESYSWTILAGNANKDENTALAVRKEAVAGRAAWFDPHYQIGRFFSDALLEQMRALKMEGWSEDDYWAEV